MKDIMNEAKALENTDDFEKAITLYEKAQEEYEKKEDYENAFYCYNKIIKVLKRESEFYRVAMNHIKVGDLYVKKNDKLNAARCFSRAGTAFVSVSASSEAAGAYEKAGNMFEGLEGEFFIESAKHYKLATLNYINQNQREFVDYKRAYDKTIAAFEKAKEKGVITNRSYLLYIANFCADVQEALNKNGFYREEKELYIKKMDYVRRGYRIRKGGMGRYITMSLWKYSCLYGESPLLWVGWICMHIVVFSLLFKLLKLVTTEQGLFLSTKESVFFSINVFATLGFGSYQLVSDFARFIVGFDVLSGYFMMAMLITIFARRLTR